MQSAQISHINRHMTEGICFETFMDYEFFLGECYLASLVGNVTGPQWRCSDTTALACNMTRSRLAASVTVPPVHWWNTHTQLLLCSDVPHHALKAQASTVIWTDIQGRRDHINNVQMVFWHDQPSSHIMGTFFSHAVRPLWESLQGMDI